MPEIQGCSAANQSLDPTLTRSLLDWGKGVRDGEWASVQAAYRSLMPITEKVPLRTWKAQNIPGFACGGYFAGKRRVTEVGEIRGLVQVDLDDVEDAASVRDKARALKYVHVGWSSVSGKGVKLICEVAPTPTTPHEYSKAAQFAGEQVCRDLDLPADYEADKAVKSVVNLCFVAHDPDAIINEEVEPLPLPQPEPKAERAVAVSSRPDVYIDNASDGNAAIYGKVSRTLVQYSLASDGSPKLYRRPGALWHSSEEGPKLLSDAEIEHIVDQVCPTMHFTKKTQRRVLVSPSVLRQAKREIPELPELKAVHGAPYLAVRPDGGCQLVSQNGYNADTGVWLRAPAEIETDLEVAECMARLFGDRRDDTDDFGSLLTDFPFEDDASRANMLAALLTAVVRPAAGLVPPALISKPSVGVGATALAKLASRLIYDRPAAVKAWTRDKDEQGKTITALLIDPPAVVVIDNVKRLDSEHLASLWTTGQHRGRLLGKSEVLDLDNTSQWFATGLRVQLSTELARRVYLIELSGRDMQSPSGYVPPDGWRIERLGRIIDGNASQPLNPEWRGYYLSAVVSLAARWADAGSPAFAGGDPMGSFEDWADITRNIMQYAASQVEGPAKELLASFLANKRRLNSEADIELDGWQQFLETVWGEHGDGQWNARAVYWLFNPGAKERPEMMQAVCDAPETLWSQGHPNRIKEFGHQLATRIGSTFELGGSAVKLMRTVNKNAGRRCYYLEPLGEEPEIEEEMFS